MSDWYSPNQQSVRADESGPAEEGSGGAGQAASPAPPDQPEPEPEVYDPAAHTVAEVQAYVTDHPDERDAIRAAETAGKGRTSLLEWLAV